MSAQKIKYEAKGFSLKIVAWLISIFAIAISGLLIFSMVNISTKTEQVNAATRDYITMKSAANDVQLASDDLTNDVRLFVANADIKYMDSYFFEANKTQRRDKALETIHELTENTSVHEVVHTSIETAVNESNNLMNLEFYAMKLICVDQSIPYSDYDEKNQVIVVDVSAVAPENRKTEALNAVFGEEYMESKATIISNVDEAIKVIDELMANNIDKNEANLRRLIIFQSIVILVNVIFMAGVVILMHVYIIAPMTAAVRALFNNEEVNVRSNKEFNYLSSIYNRIHRSNEDIKDSLKYEAEHDKLTGLFNRTGYDRVYKSLTLDKAIYVLLDIDKFKEVNDTLGHEMGDKVLVRTANVIKKYFNDENSYLFRIGGDEFAIIVNNAGAEMNDIIVEKCKKMDDEISRAEGNIPGTTLSIGVAHGTVRDTTDTLFRKADAALYKIKNAGRADVSLYK
ncbi:MAG: GGDEF domain-containing protein [Bacilli bacterium]|nr:GGDEF domain-containing protein [Bacilli bacterium]